MAVRPVVQLPVGVSGWVEIEATRPDDVVIAARLLTVDAEQRVAHLFADDNAGAMAHHFTDLRIGTEVEDYPLWDPMPAPAGDVDSDDGILAWTSDAGASGNNVTIAWLSDFGAGDTATVAWLSDVPAGG